jgi:hypothetical protein
LLFPAMAAHYVSYCRGPNGSKIIVDCLITPFRLT